MGRYEIIGLVALVIIVTVLPFYAMIEPYRMEVVQDELQEQDLTTSTDLYLNNCVTCHGLAGDGVGAMPPLNTLGKAEADPDLLYNTIAHSPHGTAMSSWHLEEGGPLNEYQVEGLVTFILHADWDYVGEVATVRDVVIPTPSAPEMDMAAMDIGEGEDPHECRSCHEEPEMHAERFGLNCSRCHTLAYWKPALLLRHTFMLDHGDEGSIACQTCHTSSYAENTCYECHDHEPEAMREAHYQEGIDEFEGCAKCHPTGAQGEAASLGYGLSGQANLDERGDDEDLGEFRLDEGTGEWGVEQPQDPGDAIPGEQRQDGQGPGASDPGPNGVNE
jgi:mono/diheme cytochrome c family protein